MADVNIPAQAYPGSFEPLTLKRVAIQKLEMVSYDLFSGFGRKRDNSAFNSQVEDGLAEIARTDGV